MKRERLEELVGECYGQLGTSLTDNIRAALLEVERETVERVQLRLVMTGMLAAAEVARSLLTEE